MTAPPAKRARTTSQTPPITASKAIQDAITSLASSSADLSPDLYSQLLGSLSTAHTKALEQEREEASVKKEQGEKEQSPSASKEPVELKSWASTIQGDLKDVERRILEDIDAGMPKLDELFFNGCRRLIHYPVLDDPAQLEAYALAKRDPIAYSARQKEEAKLHHPSLRDFLDLAEAQKRVKLRERQQE
ncbi:hypothetical protein JCM5350_007085 [Sporobolomyces pararoseus]